MEVEEYPTAIVYYRRSIKYYNQIDHLPLAHNGLPNIGHV